MKKAILVFLGCLFFSAVSAVKASDLTDAGRSTSASGWYLGLGMGCDAPVQGWSTDYLLGGGGNMFIGCSLNPSTQLQLSVSPWFFTGGGLSLVDIRVSPELKLLNPLPGWAPYFLIGPGYDFQCNSPSGYTTSSFSAVVGIGFQFDFHKGEHAFIEGRYNFLLYNNLTQEDVPVLAGLSEDL